MLRYHIYTLAQAIVQEVESVLLNELPRMVSYQYTDQQYQQSVIDLADLHPTLTSLKTTISKEVDRF